MLIRTTTYWLFAIMILAFTVYYVEYHVEGLRNTLVQLHHQMEEDSQTTAVLEAEWAYLTQPQRIRELAEMHLNTEPMTMAHMQGLKAMPVMVASKE